MARQLKPYLTAIPRVKAGMPVRWLLNQGLIIGDALDYGCGHGKCAEIMGADKYDPYHYRVKPPKDEYDTITCNYVLNVLSEEEGELVINKIKGYLKEDGIAYISVRRDVDKEVYTSKKTTQVE